MSKSAAGHNRFRYIHDLKYAWNLKYGNLENSAYVKVFRSVEALILTGLSRGAVIVPVSWTYFTHFCMQKYPHLSKLVLTHACAMLVLFVVLCSLLPLYDILGSNTTMITDNGYN